MKEKRDALQFQLAKARAEKYELERMPTMIRDTLADYFCMPVDELRARAWAHVRETAGKDGWEVVTKHCCLGGCDMDIYNLPSERDALIFSAILRAIGYRPLHNVACERCYAEYTKECI